MTVPHGEELQATPVSTDSKLKLPLPSSTELVISSMPGLHGMFSSEEKTKQNRIFSSCNDIFTLSCERLVKKKNLTQAPVELGSKCEFMSHGTLQAEVLLSIFRWLISGCVVGSSCELWLCFGLAMWHLACSSTEYAKHSAL